MSRSVLPNAAEVRRLRIEQCLDRPTLAERADVSTKTIENVENGKRVSLRSIRLVAQALKVPVAQIVTDGSSCTEPRVDVQIGLDGNYQDFVENDRIVTLTRTLSLLLKSKHKIYVIAIEDGSINVTLDMSRRDVFGLMSLLAAGTLARISITRIEVPSYMVIQSVNSIPSKLISMYGPIVMAPIAIAVLYALVRYSISLYANGNNVLAICIFAFSSIGFHLSYHWAWDSWKHKVRPLMSLSDSDGVVILRDKYEYQPPPPLIMSDQCRPL